LSQQKLNGKLKSKLVTNNKANLFNLCLTFELSSFNELIHFTELIAFGFISSNASYAKHAREHLNLF